MNVRATIRALLSNVESGAISQGGSTITQQLVKQSVLSSTKSFDRKTREAFLAVRLEKQMCKPQILERYLNTIYLGNHSYGVQAAAETYFGKEVGDLDIAEAALLAGLIRDPIDYNPFVHPDVAHERRRIALRRMVEEGKITQAQAESANAEPLPTEPVQPRPPADDYFVEEVKQHAARRSTSGRRPPPSATTRCSAVVCRSTRPSTSAAVAGRGGPQRHAGAVRGPRGSRRCSSPARTSRARTPSAPWPWPRSSRPPVPCVPSIGGPGFGDDYKFNLATQGYRQPGSSFKMFVLLELLEQGYSPDDTVSGLGPCRFDVPGVAENYEVQNFGNSRGFVGSIRSMTTNSSNCGYVRLGQIAGIHDVTQLAGELGIKTRNAQNEIVELDPTIFSTPLGTQEVTPLDMAAAYATIANDGFFNPPYFVDKVLDRDGKVVFQHRQSGYRAVSVETAQIAADILKDNVLGGTGTRARVPGYDIGGKTGTAQDFSNGWFVGFSRQLSTAIWMGAIDGQRRHARGGRPQRRHRRLVPGADLRAVHEGRARERRTAALRRPAVPSPHRLPAGRPLHRPVRLHTQPSAAAHDLDHHHRGRWRHHRHHRREQRERQRERQRQRKWQREREHDHDRDAHDHDRHHRPTDFGRLRRTMNAWKQLLDVQVLDTVLTQLDHRQQQLPERAELADVEEQLAAIRAEVEQAEQVKHELEKNQKRIEDEVSLIADKISAADKQLYGGTIGDPKQLQALQDEIASFKGRIAALEDDELELMEQVEPVDERLRELAGRRAELDEKATTLTKVIAEAEAEIDRERQRDPPATG